MLNCCITDKKKGELAMNDDDNNCIVCNRKADCFKGLSTLELDLLKRTKNTITYKKGETIIKQGTEFTHVVSFNKGLAKLNVETGPGKNLLIGIIQPSEILGGPGMFANNRYSFSVTALTECKICLISVSVFKQIIRSNDNFAEKFMSSFSSRYIDAIHRLVSITQKHMHGRLAEALLFFSDSIYKADRFDLLLSRQELADFTGMSKESVSRIFKDLSEENTIHAKGRSIEIRNKDRLIYLKETG